VGATSTIIALKYRESGLVPPKGVAAALLCGILSDTLGLRMSTTTHHDEIAVRFLAPLAGVEVAELSAALLERGMDLSGIPLAQILSRDTKEFTLSGRKVIIAQVMVPSFAWNTERSGAIDGAVAELRERTGADLAAALFTSVMENASDLHAAADGILLRRLFPGGLPVRLDGMMSRKKDFLPWLGARLGNPD
jgi:manganese-dependent inorganic pyrophosphatase